MTELERQTLQELLQELELDIQLCTTREQMIRATQRQLKLQRLLDAQPNRAPEISTVKRGY